MRDVRIRPIHDSGHKPRRNFPAVAVRAVRLEKRFARSGTLCVHTDAAVSAINIP